MPKESRCVEYSHDITMLLMNIKCLLGLLGMEKIGYPGAQHNDT